MIKKTGQIAMLHVSCCTFVLLLILSGWSVDLRSSNGLPPYHGHWDGRHPREPPFLLRRAPQSGFGQLWLAVGGISGGEGRRYTHN